MTTAASIARFCPGVLYSGRCSTEGCSLIHDVRLCQCCGVICAPAAVYENHSRGSQHRKNLAASSRTETFPFCLLCEADIGSLGSWRSHISGARHKKAATMKGLSPKIQPPDASMLGHFASHCPLCNLTVLKTQWRGHLNTPAHKRHEALAAQRGAYEVAEMDKQGVEVSPTGDIDFGVVRPEQSQGGLHKVLVIRSNNTSSVSIEKVDAFDLANRSSPVFEAQVVGDGRLKPGHDIHLRVTLRQVDFGQPEGRLEIVFRKQTRRFAVVRTIRGIVGDDADRQLLRASAPYVSKKRVPWKRGQRYLPGRRPPALDAVPWVKKLRTYPIPGDLADLLHENPSELVQQIRARFLPKVFNDSTHGLHFRRLLWLEELRMENDLRRYDLADIAFTKEGRLYFLVVPGLAEKRPSVMVGDRIEVQPSGTTEGRCFEGWVHVVRRDDVGIDFHSSFKPTGRFNIRFKLNRIPLRRQHQALGVLLSSPTCLLFPALAHVGLTTVPSARGISITPFNNLVASNHAQMQAVRSIMRLKQGAAPFIIFGPPGTGKTVTVVETIRQLLSRDLNARILACAPSNSAADILAQRLSVLGADKLFRFHAVSRDRNTVPEELLHFTHVNAQGVFSIPAVSELAKFRVIVSTCGSSSFAYGVGLPPGHFSHIFVDEAGQATEPEIMAAVKTMAVPMTQVVLSGDPKQLGPIIRSSAARELGLGVSYLERLMERDVYNDSRRGLTFVKLVRNFRSHNAVLSFPNGQFYANELEVCGNPQVINSFLGWKWLVSPRFPVIFHGISGQDERESTSPSYFNIDEVTVVKDYIQKLRTDVGYPVADEEIGVITPYRAQTRKLRKALADFAPNITVASVEEYQGQERRVIILSTVRSTRDLLEYDQRFTLGFVSNPRRFNVAVTRAQALLIVVGNPSVLSTDPLWRRFMNYVHLNGGWRGEPVAWNPNDPVEDDSQYAEQMREQGIANVAVFMQRMQAYSAHDGEEMTADEMESGANMETVFVEPE